MFRKIWVLFFVMSFYLYANSYLSSVTCSSTSYHLLKNELNLDIINTKYNSLKDYRAEAFLSNHIYSIDKTRDVGEEFQFGKNKIAKLIDYKADSSGFVAGVYVLNNKKIVIAFAGTTGKEKFSNESALWLDIKTNAQLLSNYTTDGQIYNTITYIQRMQVELTDKYPNYTITVTGHSLGGGLAQFASLASKSYYKYKKIKAITFNTAPMPLTSITKEWIDDIETQKTWSDNNNVNFMTNLDPLTLTLRFFENREEMGEALSKIFKFDKEFSLDVAYVTLKGLLGITDSDRIKKLIYGKRIILSTNSGHSILTLIKKVFPNYASYGSFRHGFIDVPVGKYGYCEVLKLMKRHVISYPRSERDYKYYPNQNTTNYEVALYIVNNFYYISYRNALKKNSSLSKFDYFIQLFSTVTGVSKGMNKDSGMSFRTFSVVMKKMYKNSITTYLFSVNILDREEVLKEILEDIDKSTFGKYRFLSNKPNIAITRMQMTKWIVDSLSFNYYQLVVKKSVKVKAERLLKFKTKGSTDNLFKPYFLGL